MTAKNLKLSKQNVDSDTDNSTLPENASNVISNYNISIDIKKAAAYMDDETGLVVGVTDISVLYETTLQITFPDKTVLNEKVTAGKVFNFSVGEHRYQLILKKVEFIYGYVRIQLMEQ